jgi:hypothetical protein
VILASACKRTRELFDNLRREKGKGERVREEETWLPELLLYRVRSRQQAVGIVTVNFETCLGFTVSNSHALRNK